MRDFETAVLGIALIFVSTFGLYFASQTFKYRSNLKKSVYSMYDKECVNNYRLVTGTDFYAINKSTSVKKSVAGFCKNGKLDNTAKLLMEMK